MRAGNSEGSVWTRLATNTGENPGDMRWAMLLGVYSSHCNSVLSVASTWRGRSLQYSILYHTRTMYTTSSALKGVCVSEVCKDVYEGQGVNTEYEYSL